MSSDLDPLAIGGSGVAGAGFVAALVKVLFGGSLARLEEKMGDLKTDTKEALSSIKEMISKSDDRHDKAIAELALQSQKVSALHQRLDVFEHAFRELERRMDRQEAK
jgi:hypothetical protein